VNYANCKGKNEILTRMWVRELYGDKSKYPDGNGG